MHCARIMIAPLIAVAALVAPSVAFAQFAADVEVNVPPPALPVYDQPPIPAPGYIWTPGYWAYGPDGYYWVPGTWAEPPEVGLLWTPGYWECERDVYFFHAGYWGPHIGFYGGINYGFGYVGTGYLGGYWNHGMFAYNKTVNNFGTTRVTNVYNKTINNNTTNTTVTRVSFHGGTGGTTVAPTPQEMAAVNERHAAPTAIQAQHAQVASTNHALLASVNRGNPAIAATARPGQFDGRGVVGAREAKGAVTPPLAGGAAAGGAAMAPLRGQDHRGPAVPSAPRATATFSTAPHQNRIPMGAGAPRPAQFGVATTPRAPAGGAMRPMGGGAPHPMANPNPMRMGGGAPHPMANPNPMRMGGAPAPMSHPAPHPQPARNPAPQKDKHG
jgi:hypothetical protein